MTSFSRALDSLWSVQSVDAMVVGANQRIERAERDIAKSEEKLAQAEATLKEAREELRRMRAKEKEHEDELTRLDARVKQYEAQGTEAGNSAAAKQRSKIDEVEMAGIKLLSDITVKESEERMRKVELDSLKSVAETQQQAARDVIQFEKQNLEQYRRMREESLENVVPELLEVYEEVNKRHPGNALVEVKDNKVCGGCSGELTLHLIQQVKLRLEIIRCPMCGRLLDTENR